MICWTIRAEAHTASKLASATLLSSATTFLAHSALWSENDAQHIYTHSLQRNSEISPRRFLKSFCLVARKQDRKIEVDEKRIFC